MTVACGHCKNSSNQRLHQAVHRRNRSAAPKLAAYVQALLLIERFAWGRHLDKYTSAG